MGSNTSKPNKPAGSSHDHPVPSTSSDVPSVIQSESLPPPDDTTPTNSQELHPTPTPEDTPPYVRPFDYNVSEAEERDKRRHYEKTVVRSVDRLSITDEETWYLISADWLHKWHAFVGHPERVNGEFVEKVYSIPGPISNESLLLEDGTPKPNLRKVTHYRGVVAPVWNFFWKEYGGGPLIRRRKIDIYSSVVEPVLPRDEGGRRESSAGGGGLG